MGSISEEIEALASLKERGLLSEEEFLQQKAVLLARANDEGTHHPRAVNVSSAHNDTSARKSSGVGKLALFGCLGTLGLVILLAAIGSQLPAPPQSIDQSGGLEGAIATDEVEMDAATANRLRPERDVDTGVTLANFNRIQSGMTYEQVRAILGEDGEEISRSDMAGYTTVMYQWEAGGFSIGGNMNAMFQNGRLVSKAQFGLP